jgi:hypothetical protein
MGVCGRRRQGIDEKHERASALSPPWATLTVAAIGDLHVRENNERRYRELFAEISEVADVLALAGDLTDFGKTGEAELLAEDLRSCTNSNWWRARQSRLRERSARRGGGDHAPRRRLSCSTTRRP